MTIGKRIQAARKNAGLSQKELGAKLGVSQSMVGQYENDLRNPKIETLQRIADALEVELGDLIGHKVVELAEKEDARGLEQALGMHEGAITFPSDEVAWWAKTVDEIINASGADQEKVYASIPEEKREIFNLYTTRLNDMLSLSPDRLKELLNFSEYLHEKDKHEKENAPK